MRKNPVFDIELKRNSRSMKCSLLVFIVNLLSAMVSLAPGTFLNRMLYPLSIVFLFLLK